jgi:uncharacterized membrane protein YdjX (TVP38/TMEM64 family)
MYLKKKKKKKKKKKNPQVASIRGKDCGHSFIWIRISPFIPTFLLSGMVNLIGIDS